MGHLVKVEGIYIEMAWARFQRMVWYCKVSDKVVVVVK